MPGPNHLGSKHLFGCQPPGGCPGDWAPGPLHAEVASSHVDSQAVLVPADVRVISSLLLLPVFLLHVQFSSPAGKAGSSLA